MVANFTCANEDPIKNEGGHNIKYKFYEAVNSVVGGGVWPKYKLIQAFMAVLVTCKNEENSFKNEGARVVTAFFHCKSMGIFNTQRQLTPQSQVRSDQNSNTSMFLWLSSLSARMKKIGAGVVTTLYIHKDTQGQLTP